jgi:urease accessory protein
MLSTATRSDAGAGAGRVAVVRRADGRSVVVRARAAAPLVLLEPRSHGDAAWLVAGTLGGGLVDGDQVALALEVGAGAALMVATQAQAKIYRGASSQRLSARVGAGGVLVCAPDPVVCFAAARYRQDAAIDLDDAASLVWLDGVTCGRRAHGERWAFASYAARMRVSVGGAVRVHDGVVLDPRHGDVAARMGRFDALATIVALGPRAGAVAAALLAAADGPLAPGADVMISASAITDGAIARVAGVAVEPVALAVRALLAPVAAVIGDDPFRGRR